MEFYLHYRSGKGGAGAFGDAKWPSRDSGNPVFNVAGDDTRPLKEFVEEIHRLCKGGGNCLYGDRKENAEGAVNLIPDIGKICRITGWKPETAFGEGIEKRPWKADKY